MTESFTVSRIIQLKTAFVSYNISRLRELIRYLPAKKYELFQNIPFWLHVNRPGVTGYVKSPHVPSGIYRFHDSGFWRRACRRFKLNERVLHRQPGDTDYIQGVYLMGSSGTLAQTAHSDLDYWVVVDEKKTDPEGRALFQKKLDRIAAHSRERYHQEVGLFVLDLADVRENTFADVDEESSGSAQRTFLKEEFYRTFIMVAGKIPYWAVLPGGLEAADYHHWIQQAASTHSLKFIPEDYIDLGSLETISRQECLGAMLWQMFKARKYPVKSLLKAALIAYYYFFVEEEGLLCDRIKGWFGGGGAAEHLIDPYALVFKTVIDFFNGMADPAGLSLAKECVFLRLSNGSASVDSPKQQLLKRYLAAWRWDEARIKRLASYHRWDEKDRLAFEEKIFNKLAFLYNLILRAHDEPNPTLSMKASDLLSLKNSISLAIKKKPGKLPRCSAYFRSHARDFPLQVSGHQDDNGREHWAIHCGRGEVLDSRNVVFTGPGLLRAIGWLIWNGFYPAEAKRIRFQAFQLPVSAKRIERFTQGVHRFLLETPNCSTGGLLADPEWERAVVLLHPLSQATDSRIESADFLAVNSWGELFYHTMALSYVTDEATVCARIAEYVLTQFKNGTDTRISCQVFQLEKQFDPGLIRNIESCLVSPGKTVLPPQQAAGDTSGVPDPAEEKLYLDLL